MNNGNGQYEADPQEVINGLINRVAQLAMEIAVKDAYIKHLEEAQVAKISEG